MSARPFEAIHARGVSRFYGRKRALSRVSLDCTQGQITVLLGHNGSGKSTLIGVLSTLLTPSDGEVLYGTMTHRDAARTHRWAIGLVAHESHLYAELTGRENLACFASLCGVADAGRTIAEAFERADLVDAANDPVGTYSRGMRQRLALERALLHDPQVVLLDEPFTGLDARSAAALLDRLTRLPSRGHIVVVTMHDFAAAAHLGDQLAILDHGRLVWSGACSPGTTEAQVRDLYQRHARS